jgi:hypothetical protein
MAVDTKHDDYMDKYEDWIKCRDFIEGSSAVKAKETDYLPALSRQTDDDYDDYLERALFYGATGRTHAALLGSVFRKDPIMTVPPDIDTSDVSMMDLSLLDFTRKVTDEVLAVGRYGVLVEYSDEELTPYFVGYRAENILNWRTERVEGRMVLTMLVLEEKDQVEGDTFYDTKEDTIYRVLRMVDGVYTVETHRSSSSGDSATPILEATIVPLRNGEPLDFIPFYFFSTTSLQSSIQKPPLLDLVEVNKSHYQSSADLENGRHLAGLPTPIFIGFDFDDQEVVLGTKHALHSTDPSARAFILEFTASGLATLEKALFDKEHLMSVMGARLLEAPRTGVEAAETARIRQAGESSLLAMVTRVLSEGMMKMMRTYVWWAGAENTDSVKIELNADFIDYRLDPAEITAYVSAYLQGAMSFETMFDNLQRGEVIPSGRTMEEEQSSIERNPPQVSYSEEP